MGNLFIGRSCCHKRVFFVGGEGHSAILIVDGYPLLLMYPPWYPFEFSPKFWVNHNLCGLNPVFSFLKTGSSWVIYKSQFLLVKTPSCNGTNPTLSLSPILSSYNPTTHFWKNNKGSAASELPKTCQAKVSITAGPGKKTASSATRPAKLRKRFGASAVLRG